MIHINPLGMLCHCAKNLVKVIENRFGLQFFINYSNPMMHELCDRILVASMARLQVNFFCVGIAFTGESESRSLSSDGSTKQRQS
jgi:hypothetical protein